MPDLKLNISVNRPKFSTFSVSGKTLAEAKKALDARDEWGLYDATQNGKSKARTDKDGQVTEVNVEVNPQIELPTWGGYGAATKEQKAAWDSMCEKLKAHELKHHDIQVACAEQLEKTLKAQKTLDAKTLTRLIADNQKDCQKKQDAYDSSSGHGAKEGVNLKLDA